MTEKQISSEEKKNMIHKAKAETQNQEAHTPGGDKAALTAFQQQVGNRAVQRLLAQRSGDGPFDLDDSTADRINRERGGGQSLDGNVQAKMSESTGQDFSDVKVHTGPESHALNQQLSAKAFTTGSDIFFREDAYEPGSSGGQELLAHELTHVVQQRSGSVGGGGGRMTVNAPGDSYEQQADSVAKAVTSSAPPVQREAAHDEGGVQAQALQRAQMPTEDDDVQMKALQRDDLPEAQEEEDETVQRQEEDEDKDLNG